MFNPSDGLLLLNQEMVWILKITVKSIQVMELLLKLRSILR